LRNGDGAGAANSSPAAAPDKKGRIENSNLRKRASRSPARMTLFKSDDDIPRKDHARQASPFT
jgi:hypothetical protein